MLQPTIPAPPVLDPVRPKPVPAASAAKASTLSVELLIDVLVAVAVFSLPSMTGSPVAAIADSGKAADAASAAAPPAAAAKSALRDRGAEALSVMFSLSWVAYDGAAVAATSMV